MPSRRPCRRLPVMLPLLAALAGGAPVSAADHDDTPTLKEAGRHDARIADLYAFVWEGRLVLALTTDPTIPSAVTDYVFAEDLTLEIAVANDGAVRFDDPVDLATYGGTIVEPARIRKDIGFRVTFRRGGPRLHTKGLSRACRGDVRFFAGLRDDPFIRGPRLGRNIAAVVVDLPLGCVVAAQPTLLVWARSRVPDVRGAVADLGGRALRSQFPGNLALNALPPRRHAAVLGVAPDVIIYDTSRPAAFPNGRALTDDVVDLVGDPGVLASDAPFPTTNDVPFLSDFPYLALPQQP